MGLKYFSLFRVSQKTWEFSDEFDLCYELALQRCVYQIDSSTIDGNVEFVHSQYSFTLTSQGSTQF